MRIRRVLIAAMTGILFLYLTACGEDDASRSPSVQLAVVTSLIYKSPFISRFSK